MSIRWVIPDTKLSMASLTSLPAGPVAGRAAVPRRRADRAAAPAATQAWWLATLNEGLPAHDPPLPVRDEAIFLLHTAAEIEHALLAQYLYAAYSLKSSDEVPDHAEEVTRWRDTLLNIAKEEMGHLMTVQNLLLLLGAPLNFEREDAPFRFGLYPFPFRLEPLGKESLAKYVLAEKPVDPANQLLTKKQVKELRTRAKLGGVAVVNRVGALYAKVLMLFSESNDANLATLRGMLPGLEAEFDKRLGPDDLLPADSPGLLLQAPTDEWSRNSDDLKVFVPPVKDRAQARAALLQIMEQGEAGSGTPEGEISHFQRFWKLYQEFPDRSEKKAWTATRRVAVNPNTLLNPPTSKKSGNITNLLTRAWAELFNLRYRLVLDVLAHYLQVTPVEAPQFVQKRGFLGGKAITEMFWLTALADKLTTMDRGAASRTGKAGPPFELPDSMALPHRDEESWRWHLKQHEEFDRLVAALSPQETAENQQFLSGLQLPDDEKAQMLTFATATPSNGAGGSATTSFQRDIKTLFRPIDVAHMRFALDLSNYDDVKANSQGVLDRLKGIGGNRMPPPPAPAWPQDQIDLFERWIQQGHPA